MKINFSPVSVYSAANKTNFGNGAYVFLRNNAASKIGAEVRKINREYTLKSDYLLDLTAELGIPKNMSARELNKIRHQRDAFLSKTFSDIGEDDSFAQKLERMTY